MPTIEAAHLKEGDHVTGCDIGQGVVEGRPILGPNGVTITLRGHRQNSTTGTLGLTDPVEIA